MVRVNASLDDIVRVFAEVEQAYRAKGFTQGSISSLEARPVGASSVFATVRWLYQGAGGETLWQSTFSYNLYGRHGAWKILLQTMHDA